MKIEIRSNKEVSLQVLRSRTLQGLIDEAKKLAPCDILSIGNTSTVFEALVDTAPQHSKLKKKDE